MVRITSSVVGEMLINARAEAPLEACGYLGLRDGIAVAHYRLTNVDQSAEHYSFDPREQFEAVRSMRESGLKPAVVYHSHPATPSRPSREDIRLAFDPDVSYVIVSLADEEPVVKSFRIRKGSVEEEPVEIVDTQ